VNSAIRLLLSSAGLYFAATLIGRLQFFVTLPLVSRQVAPSEYGLLTLASAVAVAVATTVQAAVAGAVERLYADHEGEQRRRALGTTFTLLLALAIGIGLVALALVPLLARSLAPGAEDTFLRLGRLAVGTAVATAAGAFSLALIRIEERPALALIAGVARFVIAVVGVALAVGLLGLGAVGYLGALLVAELGVTLLFQPYVQRRLRLGVDRTVLAAIRAYSWPLAPYVLLAMLRDTGDRWLLQARLPMADVGLYGVAWGVAGVMNVVVGSLTVPYAAAMMRRFGGQVPPDRHAALLGVLAPQAAIVVLLACGAYALFILVVEDAVRLLVDPVYAAAWVPAVWLGAVYVFRALYLFPHNALHWMRRTPMVPLATLGGLLTGLPIIYLSAPTLGVVAAPIGLAASYLVAWLIAARSLADWRWAFPLDAQVVLPALSTVAIALLAVLLTDGSAASTRWLVRAATGVVILAILAVALLPRVRRSTRL
jgi:O-antigen/teichoic acid export membrane protein